MPKILDVSPITNTAQMPIKKGTLRFLQDAHTETAADILKTLIGPSYNSAFPYVLYGVVNSGSGFNYNISAGAIFYGGSVYESDASSFTASASNPAIMIFNITNYTSDADPVTFTDFSTHNVHFIHRYRGQAGGSGLGVHLFSNLVRLPLSVYTEYTRAITAEQNLQSQIVATGQNLQNQIDAINGDWQQDTNAGHLTPTAGTIPFGASVDLSYHIEGSKLFVNFAFSFKIDSVHAPSVIYSAGLVGVNRSGKKVITKALSIFRTRDNSGHDSGVSHGYMTIDAINGLQMTMHYDTDVSNAGGVPTPFYHDTSAVYSVSGEFVAEIN
ncbi:MAG: hypothetical protein JWO03_3864 [Bacteroidetes bacterium]|nr:hypothetical protein [Bacteroidota bacterium]